MATRGAQLRAGILAEEGDGPGTPDIPATPMPDLRTALLLLAALATAACKSSSEDTSASATRHGKRASFHVRHELQVQLPDGAKQARIWFALPQETPDQEIRELIVEAPVATEIRQDSEGNRVLYAEAGPAAPRRFTVATTFHATRYEVLSNPDPTRARPLSPDSEIRLARDLAPNQHVPVDDEIRTLAGRITQGERNPVIAARRLYDWTLDNIEYWVKTPKTRKASPVGSTRHCLTTGTGNCTDFHSLWTSLARSQRIPTRIVYGVFLKKELDGQDMDASYHCWPEFYAEGVGWIPHDVAVADIFVAPIEVDADNEVLIRRTTADGYSGPDPRKVDYYFGNLEERRIVFSRGRDLELSPPTASGRLNALPKAHVEIDGVPGAEKEVWTRKLTYRETGS
jgi:transglutaminase-like putative cysteine protease